MGPLNVQGACPIHRVVPNLCAVPESIFVAIAGGIVAGFLVILFQATRQWWLDRHATWPYECSFIRQSINSVQVWELRVRFLNRTSSEVHVVFTPKNRSGGSANGWGVFDPWGHHSVPITVPVGPHSGKEFWVEGHDVLNSDGLDHLLVEVWTLTVGPPQSRSLPVQLPM